MMEGGGKMFICIVYDIPGKGWGWYASAQLHLPTTLFNANPGLKVTVYSNSNF
jgi:hypothetical protein